MSSVSCHAPQWRGLHHTSRTSHRVRMRSRNTHDTPTKNIASGAQSAAFLALSEGAFRPQIAGCSPGTCAQQKRVFLCTHGSFTDPAATRAGRVKSRSKKLCKFVHYRAVCIVLFSAQKTDGKFVRSREILMSARHEERFISLFDLHDCFSARDYFPLLLVEGRYLQDYIS